MGKLADLVEGLIEGEGVNGFRLCYRLHDHLLWAYESDAVGDREPLGASIIKGLSPLRFEFRHSFGQDPQRPIEARVAVDTRDPAQPSPLTLLIAPLDTPTHQV